MATSREEREAIYRLRYEVYIEEMDGRHRHQEADLSARQLRDEWDDRSYHFYVRQGDLVAACARVTLRRDGPVECEEAFEFDRLVPAFPNHISLTSRLALHPRLRGRQVLKQLTCAIYRFLCEEHIRYNFLDCHTNLLPLYTRLGFRAYRPGFNHAKYTYVIPMVLVVDDLEHLTEVRSPFVPIAQRYPCSTQWRDLLFSRFPEASGSLIATEPSGTASCEALLERLIAPGAVAPCELLTGCTLEDIRVLASLGHVVTCREGDIVLTAGDPGRQIFLILNGSFRVQGRIKAKEGGELSVSKVLSPGEVFGEIRFVAEDIRYASVRAMDDSSVLVLNAKAMDRLVVTAPKVAAKVYRNIARIVVARLWNVVGAS